MARIMAVDQVDLTLLKSNPPQVHVAAVGRVTTSGWSAPELTAWVYVMPPADGIQDFDFVATPPTGMVLDVISPISAETSLTVDPANYWGPGKPLRGVRVHAQTNSKEATFDDKKLAAGGGEVPFPFRWMRPGCASPDIRGMTLRVYKTGDALTLDLRSDRANIEVNPQTNRIVRVWAG